MRAMATDILARARKRKDRNPDREWKAIQRAKRIHEARPPKSQGSHFRAYLESLPPEEQRFWRIQLQPIGG